MTSLQELHARARSYLSRRDDDPLAFFRFGVPRVREAFRLFTCSPDNPQPIKELHLRKPNRSGGTFTLAAWMVACCQKRLTLDGVPIPQWKGRVEAVQFVLDYKRQLLSVQPAYERVLGHWPYKARYQGSALADLRIKPVGGSDDERTWSIVHFLSEDNPRAGVGIRADAVGFDEPPPIGILQEMRKAAHAGRDSVIVIAETPEHMREWAELRADYGDCPRSAITRMDWWRAECRWSLNEVEDWVIPQAEKDEMRAKYWDVETGKARDLIADARWHGDYTNAEGDSPWTELGMLTLLEMLKECREPDLKRWPIQREVDEDGTPAGEDAVMVQVWDKPKPGMHYYVCVDPASGKATGNPMGLHVSETGSGDLVARWLGHIAPYSLGVLAAGLARQYNHAVVDIEMKDHWGANVVRGCESSQYGNLAYEERELRRGVWSKEVGFDNNEEVKSIIIGQIQEWLAAWDAYFNAKREGKDLPRPYASCPSRGVIECLINAELDKRDKVVAGDGAGHFEDGVLLGQKLRKAVTRLNRPIPNVYSPPKSADQQLVDLIRGNGPRPQVGRRVFKHRSAPRA